MVKNITTTESVLFFCGFALVVFFSTFHLFESPETWMDEGFVIQSAEGLLEPRKDDVFKHYKISEMVEGYVILVPKDRKM